MCKTFFKTCSTNVSTTKKAFCTNFTKFSKIRTNSPFDCIRRCGTGSATLFLVLNIKFIFHIARKMLEYRYQLNLFKSKSGSNVFLNQHHILYLFCQASYVVATFRRNSSVDTKNANLLSSQALLAIRLVRPFLYLQTSVVEQNFQGMVPADHYRVSRLGQLIYLR